MDERKPRVNWQMFRNCNYNCSYCHHGKTVGDVNVCLSIEKIIETLSMLGKQWMLKMTGGEPLLHPNFIELCQAITRTNTISVDTNLSIEKKVKDFIENIDPEKVREVHAALHIEERERRGEVEGFIENVLLLRKNNFRVLVNYVLLPTLAKRFQADYHYFKSRGIVVYPKIFSGAYSTLTGKIIKKRVSRNLNRYSNTNLGKLRKIIQILINSTHRNIVKNLLHEEFSRKYPLSYTEEMRKIIIKYNPDPIRKIPFNSEGMKCSAGMISLVIKSNGDVRRCIADTKNIGSVFTGFKLLTNEVPCEVTSCSSFMGSNNSIQKLKERMNKEWKKAVKP